MPQVNILEARNKLSQLIKSAAAGEEVIIANRGIPVARLVGVSGAAHADETVAPFISWLKNNPLPEHARISPAEVDAAIQAERDSWE